MIESPDNFEPCPQDDFAPSLADAATHGNRLGDMATGNGAQSAATHAYRWRVGLFSSKTDCPGNQLVQEDHPTHR
jgi:hypothetical protein